MPGLITYKQLLSFFPTNLALPVYSSDRHAGCDFIGTDNFLAGGIAEGISAKSTVLQCPYPLASHLKTGYKAGPRGAGKRGRSPRMGATTLNPSYAM